MGWEREREEQDIFSWRLARLSWEKSPAQKNHNKRKEALLTLTPFHHWEESDLSQTLESTVLS